MRKLNSFFLFILIINIKNMEKTRNLVITRRSLRSLRTLREDFFCVS